MFKLYQDSVSATAQTLGVTARHVEHMLKGYFPAPPHFLEMLEKLNNGWVPLRKWAGDREWLVRTMKKHGQTIRSISEGVGIAYPTAHRYVTSGIGPKLYIMLAIEAWLETNPAPVVPGKVGRPPIPRSNDFLFCKRMMDDPEFAARHELVLAMLLRPNATPQEKIADFMLARSVMGYPER